MDWFAKHEPVRKLFNFLSKLFNQESPSRLTLKHEPVRKHFKFVNNLFSMKTFLVKGLVCKDEPVRKLFIF